MPESILPTCPRTGVRALGRRRDGRPIWPIRGGSGAADTGDSGQSTPAAPPEEQLTPTRETGGTATPEPSAPVDDRARADAEERTAQVVEERDRLRSALDAVQQALTPDKPGSAAADPAALAAAIADRDAQVTTLAEQLRTARVELAAHKVAGEHGARAERLLDSRGFLDALANLDPDGPKFATQLTEQIKAAVEADPERFATASAGPSRGGAEFNGPPTTDKRPATLREAVAARLGT
ncbi:hypothetical protein [Streptomyces fractus]|uniref:hypothetical protein n=1 Tax=Streptomyces fractus TaxID=641806 RepID=UPI003CF3BA47